MDLVMDFDDGIGYIMVSFSFYLNVECLVFEFVTEIEELPREIILNARKNDSHKFQEP